MDYGVLMADGEEGAERKWEEYGRRGEGERGISSK